VRVAEERARRPSPEANGSKSGGRKAAGSKRGAPKAAGSKRGGPNAAGSKAGRARAGASGRATRGKAARPPARAPAREQAELEREIEAAEAALRAVEEELSDPAAWATSERTARSTERHDAAKRTVEDLYSRWERVAG
jgi:ATP-binding cassette subfamily F protein 3